LRTIDEKLFYVLLYCKCYPTFDLLSVLFNFDRSCAPVAPAPTATPSTTASAPATTHASPTTPGTHGGQGGQVIETSVYHLELLTAKEPAGLHLDFYLQKGENHDPVPNAAITGQVQFPDGTQKTLNFHYSAADQHYTAILPSPTPGEYQLVILTDIQGEKVNGRFRVKI
jgi:hypothetical protein